MEEERKAAEEEALEPVDAKVRVWTSPNRLEAYMEISAPENGGEEVTPEKIRGELERQGIVFGLADAVIDRVGKDREYGEEFLVARGKPAVDGEDGVVEDCYERKRGIKLESDDNGVVDFKNLNLILDIPKDTLICKITPPTPSVDGTDVLGKKIRGVDGRKPEIPKGKNTVLSEDGTQLLVAKGGNLSFEDGVFQVDDVLRIPGVNNSIGNIEFSGDILVDGDVREGFVVRSHGNVTVRGSVEGAEIYADGSITLAKGMNGMQKGILYAKGDLHCKFLENCTANAGGSIFAESILNSTSCAENKIVVQGRRAIIVGGSCSAKNSIEATAVGSESHIPTTIRLGATPDMLQKQKELSQQVDELQEKLQEAVRDAAYLEELSKQGKLMKNRLPVLGEKRKMKTIYMMQLSRAKKQLDDVEKNIENVGDCQLKCREIYPPSKIYFGNASVMVQSPARNCLFYYADKEIKMGTA